MEGWKDSGSRANPRKMNTRSNILFFRVSGEGMAGSERSNRKYFLGSILGSRRNNKAGMGVGTRLVLRTEGGLGAVCRQLKQSSR